MDPCKCTIYSIIVQFKNKKVMDFAINYVKRLSEIIKPPELNN